mgnify:CR=1 FL=1
MGSIKEKKGITLLALVITIVIMLLLAGIAIQMTMGKNGLIAKSEQAQKAQTKAELYETAKLSYTNLKAKAAENGEPSPQAELALYTTEFTNKYNVVGDDVTDKNGNVIDTKENLINTLKMLYHDATKNIGGIKIPASDKDKLIIKVNVRNKTTVTFGRLESISNNPNTKPVKIEYESGEEEMTSLYSGNTKEYEPGEYIVKFSGISNYAISGEYNGEYDIEILQWGKIEEINEENEITLSNVSKIYEPEPDKIPIKYMNVKFQQIPEWLFSKKVTSKVMSKFWYSNNIKSIPERLFEKNVNATNFNDLFNECEGITSIPEKLFENNVKAISFEFVFFRCRELKSIPENLFKNNINVTDFSGSFWECKKITNIPEKLFENNVKVTKFNSTFFACEGLTNIPENLFKNNINVINFGNLFYLCTGITSIPNNIIEFSKRVKNRGGDIDDMFKYTSVANYEKLLR